MTTPLNEPVIEYVNDPEPHHPIEGDVRDDDAIAIDQYFEPNPGLPPDYSGLVADDKIRPRSRIVSRFLPIGDATQWFEPVLLLPPSAPNEERVKVFVASTVDFRCGSDKTDVYGGALAAGSNGANPLDLSGHDGAIWVIGNTSAALPVATVYVNVWCIIQLRDDK